RDGRRWARSIGCIGRPGGILNVFRVPDHFGSSCGEGAARATGPARVRPGGGTGRPGLSVESGRDEGSGRGERGTLGQGQQTVPQREEVAVTREAKGPRRAVSMLLLAVAVVRLGA